MYTVREWTKRNGEWTSSFTDCDSLNEAVRCGKEFIEDKTMDEEERDYEIIESEPRTLTRKSSRMLPDEREMLLYKTLKNNRANAWNRYSYADEHGEKEKSVNFECWYTLNKVIMMMEDDDKLLRMAYIWDVIEKENLPEELRKEV